MEKYEQEYCFPWILVHEGDEALRETESPQENRNEKDQKTLSPVFSDRM